MEKLKRVSLYLRVSTTDQDTAMQRRELIEFAKARGWEIVGIYSDDGYTGTNSNRPQLKRLMADAKNRKCDIIATYKLDRFSRSLKELVLMLQDLADVGVEFCSLKDQLDLTTASGKLMFHMVAAFAEFEASIIKSRVLSGLANAKAKGIKLGRPQTRNDQKVRSLTAKGFSHRAIASQLGISKGSVQNALKGWTKNPSKVESVTP